MICASILQNSSQCILISGYCAECKIVRICLAMVSLRASFPKHSSTQIFAVIIMFFLTRIKPEPPSFGKGIRLAIYQNDGGPVGTHEAISHYHFDNGWGC